jgi:hypothetical protein
MVNMRKIMVAALACVVLVSLFVVIRGAYVKRQARHLIEALAQIPLAARENDAMTVMAGFSSLRGEYSSESNESALTGVTYGVSMPILNRVGIYPDTLLIGTIKFRNGTVVSKTISYYTGHVHVTVVEGEDNDIPHQPSLPYEATSNGTPNALRVYLGPTADNRVRQMAYNIKLQCFLTAAGCSQAQEVIPIAVTD